MYPRWLRKLVCGLIGHDLDVVALSEGWEAWGCQRCGEPAKVIPPLDS